MDSRYANVFQAKRKHIDKSHSIRLPSSLSQPSRIGAQPHSDHTKEQLRRRYPLYRKQPELDVAVANIATAVDAVLIITIANFRTGALVVADLITAH